LVFTTARSASRSRSSGRIRPGAEPPEREPVPATTTEIPPALICRASVRACFAVSWWWCGIHHAVVAHAIFENQTRAHCRLPVLHLERHADAADESVAVCGRARSPPGTAASRIRDAADLSGSRALEEPSALRGMVSFS